MARPFFSIYPVAYFSKQLSRGGRNLIPFTLLISVSLLTLAHKVNKQLHTKPTAWKPVLINDGVKLIL